MPVYVNLYPSLVQQFKHKFIKASADSSRGNMAAHRQILEKLHRLSGTALDMALVYAIAVGVVIAVSDGVMVAFAIQSSWLGYFLVLKGLVVVAVTGAVMVLILHRNTSQQAAIQKELYLAHHDPSTNLFRRPEWIRRVDSLL